MKISRDLLSLTTTQGEFAKVLKLSQPRIYQLLQDGIIIRDKTGAILVFQSLENFYKSRVATPAGEIDINEERAKYERARRVMAELKVAKMTRRVYSAQTVELVMIEMLSNLRTQLLGLPSKLAPIAEGKTKDEIYSMMTREIEEKLAELSEYSPEMFDAEIEETDDEDGE